MPNTTWDIKYNTEEDELLYSEYGRTVQELLQRADEVADDERQAYVERVVKLMLQMQPDIKQQENYEERLWKHAFRIAGGELNVTVPEGIDAAPDEAPPKPDPLPYPELSKRKVQYGQNVIRLIEAGAQMEDGPERDHLVLTAAYYMKIALTDWRGGKFASEKMLRNDLYELSGGKLALPPDAKLGTPNANQPSQDIGLGRRKKKKKSKKKSKSAYGGNSNNNNSGGGGGGSSRSRKSRNRRRR